MLKLVSAERQSGEQHFRDAKQRLSGTKEKWIFYSQLLCFFYTYTTAASAILLQAPHPSIIARERNNSLTLSLSHTHTHKHTRLSTRLDSTRLSHRALRADKLKCTHPESGGGTPSPLSPVTAVACHCFLTGSRRWRFWWCRIGTGAPRDVTRSAPPRA